MAVKLESPVVEPNRFRKHLSFEIEDLKSGFQVRMSFGMLGFPPLEVQFFQAEDGGDVLNLVRELVNSRM